MIEIEGLTKRYGAKTVIENLDLHVPKQTVYGFLGPNGAGKTTVMKCLLGLETPDTGIIKVDGQLVKPGQNQTNQLIGYLPDVPQFYSFYQAKEYLYFCGEIAGISRKAYHRRTEELLELVGLRGEKGRIGSYSRGMKQRLGLAQALLHQPKLIICDEPTSALDPIGRKELLDLLQQLKSEATVLFSTHILSDVERICDEVSILAHGKIQVTTKLSDLSIGHSTGKKVVFSTCEQASLIAQQCGLGLPLNNEVYVPASFSQELFFETITKNQMYPYAIEPLIQSFESIYLEAVK